MFRNVLLLECGTLPENFIDPIVKFKPSHVILVDAALLGCKPGHFKLVSIDDVVGTSISTHTLPLNVFATYLKALTGAKIALLAIQPKDRDFGEGLSSEVSKAVRFLTIILIEILGNLEKEMRNEKGI